MSTLVAIGYENEQKADEVLGTLARLQKEHLIDLEDAAIVVRGDDGKIKVKQTYDLVAAGAAGGSFWGLLFGVLFLHPLVGVLAGAAAGAASGAMADIGINDDFMKELGETLEPGSSALFIYVRKATPDKVIEELTPYGGRLLHTSLSHKDENALRATLQQHQQALAEKA